MSEVPIDQEGIMQEFQIAESLYDRGYIPEEKYEQYKKDVAFRLISAYNGIDKRPWWRRLL